MANKKKRMRRKPGLGGKGYTPSLRDSNKRRTLKRHIKAYPEDLSAAKALQRWETSGVPQKH